MIAYGILIFFIWTLFASQAIFLPLWLAIILTVMCVVMIVIKAMRLITEITMFMNGGD